MHTQCPECSLMFTPENLQIELDAALMVIANLKAENARYRAALEFGLNKMMPEIKAQKGCWPGEIDDFEDRAREALKGGNGD